MRSPVSTPAGTLTGSVFSCRTRPWPKQVSQGLEMILPRPLQRGQGCWMVKMDCCTRTWPWPLQVSQVFGVEPLAAPRALAGLALAHGGNVDLGLGAEHRLLQIQFQLVAQVCAAEHLRSAALAAGKNIAEHFAENIAERLAGAESAAAVALQARVAELIVDGALMRIAQDLVGLFAFFETVLGFRIVGIAIRVKFHREAAIGLFDFGFRRVSRQVEELIVILLRHC